MSVTLNPVTIEKLDQFRRRRRTMVLIRGISAAVLTFLLAMLIVSVVDWLWVLSSSTRWTLSAVGYAASVAVFGWLGLRRLWHDGDRRELASRVEVAEPRLREQLLAAIELGDSDRGSVPNGSPVFRALVQDRVAGAFSGIDVRSLLPIALVRRWLLAALGIVALCAVLWMIPGSHFRQLITRAMLPMANIDRVSRTQVEILEPTPHSLQVPENETVAVVVRIGGAKASDVTLEILPFDGEASQQTMRLRSSAGLAAETEDFDSNISVGKSDLEYRILAGDAVTRTYRIRTAPRPLVQQVEKQYRYPEYTQLSPETVTEDNGDLEALSGTVATLRFTLNQPVSVAEIVFDVPRDAQPRRVPLQAVEGAPLVYTVELPIEEPEVYRVHLVAADTGFENPFSPKYEIRPLPDRVPRVAFVEPPEGSLLLPPNDLVPLTVSVQDELPVARTMYQVSVNSGPWKPRTLSTEVNAQTTTSFDWDLSEWQLTAGDLVSIRAAALDRKGQRGESAPLQIVIAMPDFDPERHSVTEAKLALLAPLQTWALAADELRNAMNEALKPVEAGEKPQLGQADRDAFVQQASELEQLSDRLIAESLELLPNLPAGWDASQVELVARASDRVRYTIGQLRMQLSNPPNFERDDPTNAGVLRKNHAVQLRQQMAAAADLAKRTGSGFEAQISHDVNAAVMADIDGLSTHVNRLVLPSIKTSWQRLLRQHTVTVNQLTALQQWIADKSGRITDSSRGSLNQVSEWATRWQDQLDQRMAGEHQADELRRVSEQLAAELRQRLNNSTLDGGLPARIKNDYHDIDRRIGSIAQSIQQLQKDLQPAATAMTAAEKSGESETVRRTTEQWIEALQMVARTQPRIGAQFEAWRRLQQMRRDADTQFPSDAALAARALQAVTERSTEAEVGTATDAQQLMADLAEIAAAYQILESGHEVQQFRSEIDSLTESERWDALTIRGRTLHPLAWERIQDANELVLQRVREAQLPQEVLNPLEQMRWSAATKKIQDRMAVRRWDGSNVLSALEPLISKRENVDEVLVTLQPHMHEARQRLAKFVPNTAQLARTTAEQLRKLSEQTEQAAEQAAQQAEAGEDLSPPDLQALEQEQADAEAQVQELLDALVDQANAQDLMTPEGRETARDADDAVAMITPPAEAMQAEMEQAAAAEDAQVAAENLQQAADSQVDTAEALERVAEHLERQAAGEDVEETRQALRDIEHQMGIQRQMDQQYEQAEQLANAATQDPQTLLQQLEAELKRNEEMQKALSDIAANAAQEAQNALEQSAQTEQNIQRDVERSDIEFQARKAMLAAQVKDLNQAMNEIAQHLAAPASNAAQQGQDEESKQALDEAQDNLHQAVQATQAINPDSLLSDLASAAEQAAQALQQASEQFETAQQSAAEAQAEPIHQNDQQQKAQRDQAQRNQQQVKEARQRAASQQTQQRKREETQANAVVEQAEKQQQAAEKQLQQATEALQKNPDQQSAQNNQQQAQQRAEQAQLKSQLAKTAAEATKQRREQAEATEKQRNEWQTPALEQQNPAAQLAARLAQEAAEAATQMGEQAQQIAKQADFQADLQGDAEQLARAEQQQAEVGQDVQQAGENLARAARHEQRLGRTAPAEQLNQTAQAIERTSEQELSQAQQAVEQAAAANTPPADADGESPDGAPAEPAPPPAADAGQAEVAEAQQALAVAEDALQQQADALDNMLAADALAQAEAMAAADQAAAPSGEAPTGEAPTGEAPSGQAPTGQAPSGQAPTGEAPTGQAPAGESGQPAVPALQQPRPAGTPARGAMLARALDDLDRALNSAPSSEAESQASQPPSSSPSSPSASSPTLAQAARERMRSMAISRSQARASSSEASQPSEATESGAGEGSTPPEVFDLNRPDRDEQREWGQLTQKSAEDLTEGRRDRVAERYRQQVEAYFRVIAEQSKPK